LAQVPLWLIRFLVLLFCPFFAAAMPPAQASMEIEAPSPAAAEAAPSAGTRKIGAALFAFAGCAALVYAGRSGGAISQPGAESLVASGHGPQRVGSGRDERGCLSAAGFSWCPHSSSCVRGWSQSCPSGTEVCQQLCAIEPDFNTMGDLEGILDGAEELEACEGDHESWSQSAGDLEGILGGAEERYRSCSSYSENRAGCDENTNSEGLLASRACPQCQRCSVIRGRTCRCSAGAALDYAPPADMV